MKTDVLVIGAGAIGLSLAFELACRGRQVIVVDQDWIDTGAGADAETEKRLGHRVATSWAAAGILPPANLHLATDPLEQLRGLSHQLFPGLAAKLHSETGIDCELDRCGGWYLANTPGERAAMAGMTSFWKDLEIECVDTPLDQLARSEPELSDWTMRFPNAKAWWVPDEYQIRSPRYLQALAAACKNRGVQLQNHRQVVDLDERDGGVIVSIKDETNHDETNETITAHQVVVCGGAWTGSIAKRLRLEQSIIPVRGQILLLQCETPVFKSVVNLGNRYFVPRRDGKVLIGSCEEEVGLEHGTTPQAITELRELIDETCPALRTALEINAWSGLRPMTFDGFPMCGKLPDSDSIFVASGHFRSGVHLSPGTANCMAAILCDESPALDMDAFRVGKQQRHTH